MTSPAFDKDTIEFFFGGDGGKQLSTIFEDHLSLLKKNSWKYFNAKRFIQSFNRKLALAIPSPNETKEIKDARIEKAKRKMDEFLQKQKEKKELERQIKKAAEACVKDDDFEWSEFADSDEPPQKKMKCGAVISGKDFLDLEAKAVGRNLSDDEVNEDEYDYNDGFLVDESNSSSSSSSSSSSICSSSGSSSSSSSSESESEDDIVQLSRREKLAAKVLKQQQGGGMQTNNNVSISAKIINDEQYSHDRFNRDVFSTTYKIHHNLNEVDILSAAKELDLLFAKFINEKIENYRDNDIVCVTITHEKLSDIFINKKKKDFDVEDIATAIAEVNQSNQSFLLDGILNLEIQVIKEKTGSGKFPMTVIQKRKRCKGLIHISNKDNSCGYMAIALAYYYHEFKHDDYNHDRKRFRMNSGGCLKKYARDMFSKLGLNIETPLGMNDINTISNYLHTKKIQLVVVNGITKTKDFDDEIIEDNQIYVELYDNHYNTISSINKYFGKNHFCYFCWTAFDKPSHHKCKKCCASCQEAKSCSGEEKKCNDCKRVFFGEECYKNHLKKICAHRKFCERCESEYIKLKKPHQCLVYFCQNCYEHFDQSPHYCFIKKLDLEKLQKEDKQLQIFVAFDIESKVDKMDINSSYDKHTPDLLVANIVCNECYDSETNTKSRCCDICGDFEVYFEGEDCVKNFCDFLYSDLSKRATNKGRVIVFAHNFKGYDGHFVIQDVFEREFVEISPVQKGTKILKLDVGNVRFIDTYNFFQVPLSSLPKEFGFQDRVVKGFFPYKFNNMQNSNYVGSIPPFKTFVTDRMSEGEIQKVREWYDARQYSVYNLNEEKLKYCRNDVEILLLAFMSFKKLMISTTGINPFTRSFTIASMVFEVARALFIKDRQIGITPISEYRPVRNSVIANVWLDIQQKYVEKKIIREYRIGKYYADGCLPNDALVFEFLGCAYHGCKKCYSKNRDITLFNGKTPNQLFDEWESKNEYYHKMQFNVAFVWECDFKSQYKNVDVSEKIYFDERKLHYSLKKRHGVCDIRGEAFLGGRTNNFRFFYEHKQNERIRYLDIRSSYPNVMKRRKYPVGHPVSINEDFDYTLQPYFGFVKAIVLPPSNLFLPSLPLRVNKKLLFPLCYTCASVRNCKPCNHSEKERYLVSTWTVESLKIALTEGYKIVRILHVLHWDETVDDMFTEQMNTFAKIKLEASGYPSYCKTEQEKTEYVQQILDKEGIQLNPSNIKYCALLRFLGKIGLNSTYGKFGQNANMVQTSICSDYATLWNILNNAELNVLGVVKRSEKSLTVSYQKKNIEDCSPGNTSVAIAAMVTDYARIELLKYMKTIVRNGEDRLLYTDTDSVLFIEKCGDEKLPLGPFIGDLTDEIADKYGSDAFITKMVAAGPKNYAFEVKNGAKTEAVVKLKGIQQNAKTLSIVNIKKMTEMVYEYVNGNLNFTVKVPQFRIQADKKTHNVTSFDFEKVYRCVSEKRRICGNGTVPYGFKGECPY